MSNKEICGFNEGSPCCCLADWGSAAGWVVDEQHAVIGERALGFLEGDSVLPLVCGALGGVPFESELGHTATYVRRMDLVHGDARHCKSPAIWADASVPLLRAVCPCDILNHMVQYQRPHLDASFAALSDATRRGILERLGRGDASITELAGKFQMTLTGMKKHIGVLERTGLVTTEKAGRVRTCKLGPRRLDEEAAWIGSYRQLWRARFDELDKIVEELKRTERVHARQTTK